MNDFIEWCNTNQGFVSALLTIFSIFLSVVAIVVSIKVSKLPFKKKIAIAYFTNIGVGFSENVQYFSVEATNIGNRVLKVKYVGIGYKNHFKWKKAFNLKNANPSNVMLGINETAEAQYEMEQVYSMSNHNKLYAIAIDIEGKVYRRRIK